jgi:probable rRNA maturation factor
MVVVQIANNFQDVDVCPAKLERLVKAICKRFKVSAATVSIGIVDDAEMRRLNARFLNRKGASDCLSFDLSDDKSPATDKSFELVVNGEKAVEEARLRGHSSEAELALYVTHGLLHNLGFDDSGPKKAKKMHDTEDEILQQFGYGLVYNKSKRISGTE